MISTSAFRDDLARDLEDPEFLRELVVESMRIATIDEVVNALDDAREAAGLSKRLHASEKSNPTLGTLAEVAAALGMRITLEPLADEERTQVTEPFLAGRTADPAGLARHLHSLRTRYKVAASHQPIERCCGSDTPHPSSTPPRSPRAQGRAERLVSPIDNHQQRLLLTLGLVVEQAEQS